MVWAILSTNIKGGTGKSTVAQTIAEELRDKGYDVGILDADIDSANLASRMGADEKVTHTGDHIIEPVEHNGMKVYSMENAFEDASFSQTGDFMGEVVSDMVNNSDWGEIDYLVVDCPPGSSDVFKELVRSLRKNILGAISVGIPDAVDDTVRLVKICNHSWVPIIGFIENMSGVYCHGERVTCKGDSDSKFGNGGSHNVAPFGEGEIKRFVEKIDGNFLGKIPLCGDETEIKDVSEDTINSTIEAIENAETPELPEDNIGDRSFIKNIWGTVVEGIKKINSQVDIEGIQDKYGVKNRESLVLELELTDADGLKSIFSNLVVTVDGGKVKGMRKKKAIKRGYEPEAGVKMTSQTLYYAMKGEKKVMRAITGEIITEDYSITDAIRMGDAEMWGDKTINRLSVLDRILSEAISDEEMNEIVGEI